MDGVKFDEDKLELGIPVKWTIVGECVGAKVYSNDRFGLISGYSEKAITIMAFDSNRTEFREKRYDIDQIAEFEILGEWQNKKEAK